MNQLMNAERLTKITDENIPEGEGDFLVVCEDEKGLCLFIGSLFKIESNYYGVAYENEAQLNATHFISKNAAIKLLCAQSQIGE